MTAPRTTAARLQQLRAQLSSQDLFVLTTVRRLRVVTAAQLSVLLYPDGLPASNARMTRRIVRKLVGLRLLAELPYRPGGIRGGAKAAVFSLDVAGLRLTDPDGYVSRKARRPYVATPAFLDHHLATTQLFVDLTVVTRHGRSELLTFETEPAAWRSYAASLNGPQTLKPDAFFVVATDSGRDAYQDHWFVEIDMGSQSPAAIARKLDAYRAYQATGLELREQGVHPRTLFVVQDEARAARLSTLVQKDAAKELFAVVSASHAAEQLTGPAPP